MIAGSLPAGTGHEITPEFVGMTAPPRDARDPG
jgi:hypothetical protein